MRRGRRIVRRRRRVVIPRRGKVLSRPAVKQVKRISRFTLLKNSETKRHFILNENWGIYPATGTPRNNYVYANIFSPLTQGFAQNTFEGDNILDPLFVARVKFDLRPTLLEADLVNPSWLPEIWCHVWLLASNDQFSQVTPTVIDGGTPPFNGLDWFLQTEASRVQMNGDSCTVIKHIRRKLRPYDTGLVLQSNPSTSVKLVAKLKGRKIFEPGSPNTPNTPADVLKGWNYYLVCGWGITDGSGSPTLSWPITGTGPVSVTVDRYVYFKDP